MSLFDKLKNKRSSLQEKKDDTTGRGKKPIKVNLKNLIIIFIVFILILLQEDY